MKLLSGTELAGFIKPRQSQVVQRMAKKPVLAIIQTTDDPVIATFVRLKGRYGEDIGVDVQLHKIDQQQIRNLISQLNQDTNVTGVIIQLPLANPQQTDEILNLVNPAKDVDALAKNSQFAAPTPMAILWVLAGHNIELKDKNILIIGQGRLVGSPLKTMLDKSSFRSVIADINTSATNLKKLCLEADIIISAAGSPGLLRPEMVKTGAIIVDAGTSSENGKQVGDASPELYEREDIAITPVRGGIGPLTIAALFENVLIANQK